MPIKDLFSAVPLRTSIFFWLNVLFLLSLLLFSCSKDNDSFGPKGEKNSVLVFEVQGVKTAEVKGPKLKSAMRISGQMEQGIPGKLFATTNLRNGSGFSADLYAEQVQIGTSVASLRQFKPTMEATMADPPSKSTMKEGNTYRVLLYEKNSGRLAGNVQAKAGTSISIDVYKGETYEMYAYSFNDDEDIPEPIDPLNPSVESSIHKDLLYAHPADVTIPDREGTPSVTVPLLFEHKLAQVSVRMDLTGLANYGDIMQLRAAFVNNNYLKEASFNMKGGTVSGSPTVVAISDIDLVKDSVRHVYEANFFTADPSAAAAIRVRLEELLMQFYYVDPADATKDLATHLGEPKPVFSYNFDTPTYGDRLTGVARLFYRSAAKRLLHVSSKGLHRYMGYALEADLGWALLNTPINFGDEANSAVRMTPDGAGRVWKGSADADNMTNNYIRYQNVDDNGNTVDISGQIEPEIINRLLSTDPNIRPDIMITGYGFEIRTQGLADAILTYLNQGGVVVMMTSWSRGQFEYFFKELLGGNPKVNSYGADGYVYPFTVMDVSDRIMNGPFGNINPNTPHWGTYSGGLMTLSTAGANATVYSRGQASNSAITTGTGINIFKHNLKNFFFIGSGTFTGTGEHDIGAYTSPFKLDQNTKYPVQTPYGVPGNGIPQHKYWMSNSQFIANVMAWAVAASELDGNVNWRYAGPPR